VTDIITTAAATTITSKDKRLREAPTRALPLHPL
jgi:hypothetical protein